MTDKDLRREKEELMKALFEKIDYVTNNNDLADIFNTVKSVNDILDEHDTKFGNLIDSINEIFKPRTKDKIKEKIRDIFDNYDKKEKDGSLKYSNREREIISEMIKQIDEICNRNFWDRFKKVLGIGS